MKQVTQPSCNGKDKHRDNDKVGYLLKRDLAMVLILFHLKISNIDIYIRHTDSRTKRTGQFIEPDNARVFMLKRLESCYI